jgi:hypothetical protein
MTKKDLLRALWMLVKVHKRGPYCKNDCALRGELRGLLKRVK